MELIDTHCHLSFDDFAGNVDAVIARSVAAGVTGWINIGTTIEQSQKSILLAEKVENMYATIGIHPHYAKDANAKAIAELKRLAQSKKVVAVGEAGLDFHYTSSEKSEQKQFFIEQLKLAADLDLPFIVHSREAFKETMDILDEFSGGVKRIVFHCFGGSPEQAKLILSRGFYISFTGVVTFKNAESVRQSAGIVPIDRLMVETDCPFISPEPVRRQKINEPALMVHTAAKLAEIKQMGLDGFAEAVTATSKAFFGI
ncbi:MAG: TatD family hydrolase [Planctomycetota bacterium]|jgi:TatD DNase family protein